MAVLVSNLRFFTFFRWYMNDFGLVFDELLKHAAHAQTEIGCPDTSVIEQPTVSPNLFLSVFILGV